MEDAEKSPKMGLPKTAEMRESDSLGLWWRRKQLLQHLATA